MAVLDMEASHDNHKTSLILPFHIRSKLLTKKKKIVKSKTFARKECPGFGAATPCLMALIMMAL
jgi:hypothetical protein